jgi:hypothetical protein
LHPERRYPIARSARGDSDKCCKQGYVHSIALFKEHNF